MTMTTQEIEAKFNQGMATVSLIDQVPALKAIHTEASEMEARKADYIVRVGGEGEIKVKNGHVKDAGHVFFDDQGNMVVQQPNGEAAPYSLTNHAWGQFGARMGGILVPNSALHRATFEHGTRHQSPAIRAAACDLLNAVIGEADPDAMYVRTYEGTARAVMSTSYADIGNLEIINGIAESLDYQRQRFGLDTAAIQLTNRSHVTPDNLYLAVVSKGIDPRDEALPGDEKYWEGRGGIPGGMPYGIGAVVRNNEVGKGRLSVSPFIQRGPCNNSIVINSEDTLNMVHRGMRSSLSFAFTAAIASALRIGAEYLKRLMDARGVAIENPYAALDHLSELFGWTTDQNHLALKGMENQSNLYGLVNAVAYVPAHSEKDSEAVQAFEALAGGLLANPAQYFPAKKEFAWVENVQPAATAK
jgi:hypothetical protein